MIHKLLYGELSLSLSHMQESILFIVQDDDVCNIYINPFPTRLALSLGTYNLTLVPQICMHTVIYWHFDDDVLV